MYVDLFNAILFIVLLVLIVSATFLIGLFVGVDSGRKQAGKEYQSLMKQIAESINGASDN